MRYSPVFSLGITEGGEIFSSAVDEDSMTAIDNQLYMLSGIPGDGVIEGFEVSNANNGNFQVNISNGKAKIDNIFVERPNDLQTDDPIVLTILANSNNYIYARLATLLDSDIDGVSPHPSSYTKVAYFSSTTNLGDIPSDSIRIANVITGSSSSNMTIDNSVKRIIALMAAKVQDVLEYYLLIHKHDNAAPLYISKIVLTTEVTKETTTIPGNNTIFVTSDGSWLDPNNTFPEIPVENSDTNISTMTDEQVQVRLNDLFSKIEVIVNNVVVDCYYNLNHKEGQIEFINPLPNNAVVKIKFYKNISRIQISDKLENYRLNSFDGSKITTGTLGTTVIPQISHTGRVKEKLLPYNKYNASTDDYYAYTVELLGHSYQSLIYIYSIFVSEDRIYLGTSKGLLKSIDDGSSYSEISIDSYLDSPIVKMIYDIDSDFIFLMTYNNLGLLNSESGSVRNISEDSFAEEIVFIDIAKSELNNVLFAVTNAGLFRTMDFGDSWQFINVAQNNLKAVDVWGEDIIFVSSDKDLYKSSDRGITWSKISSFNYSIKKIKVVHENCIIITTENRVYITLNGGNNWNAITPNSDYGYIHNILYNANNDDVYILTSNGIFLTSINSVTANKKYILEIFSACIQGDRVYFGSKSNLLYNQVDLDDDFFGIYSSFGENRTPVLYLNDELINTGFWWYFKSKYKIIFEDLKRDNDVIKVADNFTQFIPENGAWDRSNIILKTSTSDRVRYKVEGILDKYAQNFVFTSSSSDPIDDDYYIINYDSNTVTFINPDSGASESINDIANENLGGISSKDFINPQNFSTNQYAGATSSEIFPSSENSSGSVAVASQNISPNQIINRNESSISQVRTSSFEPNINDVITVGYTKIIIYKNGQEINETIYSRDYSTGIITFNDQQDITDDFVITIFGTSISETGSKSHNDIDDDLSDNQFGMTHGSSNVFMNNLNHLTLAIKHALPYDVDGKKFESYMKNVYYHTFGVDLDSYYDKFNSTLDKNIAIEQEVLPESFHSVYSILRPKNQPNSLLLGTENGVWLTQDNGIVCNIKGEEEEIEIVYALSEPLTAVIYAGGNHSLHKSVDGGENWDTESCSDNYNLPSIVYDIYLAGDGKIYIATENGIYMNYGKNSAPEDMTDKNQESVWHQIAFDGIKVYGLSESEDNLIFAATIDGLYISNADVSSWSILGLSSISCRSVYYDYFRDVLYVGTNNGIYYSLNDGSTFINVGSISDKILTIKRDYFGAIWFGGISGLYRISPAKTISQTAFETISEISDIIFPIYALENNSIGKGYLVAGTKKGLMFINDSQINKILYAFPYLFMATNKGVFRIILNGSREWENTTSMLTDAIYNDIILLVSGVPGRLISGSDFGIIVSDDDGSSWTQTLSTDEAVLDVVEINTGVNAGVYVTTPLVIYKSIDSGLNWSEYLLASDFPGIEEFSQFFAVLEYI